MRCHVDAIVHEEWCAIARADLAEPQRELEELARGEILLAQLHGVYILAQNRAGLVLVDMHAAHERIVYERLKLQMDSLAAAGTAGRLASQPLLIPATFAATPQEIATAESCAATLHALGLEITPFSPRTRWPGLHAKQA